MRAVMTLRLERGAVRLLAVAVSVLLPAGGLAALTVGAPSAGREGRVGATALSASALDEEEQGSQSTQTTAVTIAPAPGVPGAPPTSPPPAGGPRTPAPTGATAQTSTTRAPKAPAGFPVPPGFPPLPMPPPPTGIPNIPPSSSWSHEEDGIRVRLRLDPPAPVAGQPMRFVIDYSSASPCCTVMLNFGDGTAGFSLNNDRVCGTSPPLTSGAHTVAATHTYTAARAYKANLFLVRDDWCANPPPMVNGAPQIVIHDVSFDACLAVGPGTRGQAGCSPFPPFGPDSIVSPVIDPYCQVRSDCTKASTPRPGWDDPA
jgi:hypothetical protein